MDVLSPLTLDEALDAKARRPDAVPLAGGTDLMVEINFDLRRPGALLDLTRVPELAQWDRHDGRIRVGAGVTYARLITELAGPLPGLAVASRTVGSPQIRNRGTLGGNLGTASPAGDALPVVAATEALIAVASIRGARTVALDDLITGVKSTSLAGEELITAVDFPVA